MKNNLNIKILFILFFSFINIKCQTIVNMDGSETYPYNWDKNGQYYLKMSIIIWIILLELGNM